MVLKDYSRYSPFHFVNIPGWYVMFVADMSREGVLSRVVVVISRTVPLAEYMFGNSDHDDSLRSNTSSSRQHISHPSDLSPTSHAPNQEHASRTIPAAATRAVYTILASESSDG